MTGQRETGSINTVSEADLHAYIDGELPAEREALVEAYLSTHPEEARRMETYRADGEAIARIFSRVAQAPVWRSGLRQRLLRIAAVIGLLILGSTAGWLAHDRLNPAPDALVREAAAAHVIFASTAGPASSSLPLGNETLETVIAAVLGVPVRLPEVKDLGYELRAARTLPSSTTTAVQLVYSAAGTPPISVYLRARPGAVETPLRVSREGPIGAVSWEDDDLDCAISGEADVKQLQAVARRVYLAINP
jgi:anti-sigma factor RsiW